MNYTIWVSKVNFCESLTYVCICHEVRNCNNYSEYFGCAVGLRQGEVMSPIMFAMFINDLESFLCNDINSGSILNDAIFILLLFADDMVVLGKFVDDLQQSLDLLKQYCDKWDLEVNILKTKTMVFRKRGDIFENEKWYFDGKLLQNVNDFNYLASCFNYTGSFTSNQELLAEKGLKAMNELLYN